jgi:hypothetical protein
MNENDGSINAERLSLERFPDMGRVVSFHAVYLAQWDPFGVPEKRVIPSLGKLNLSVIH